MPVKDRVIFVPRGPRGLTGPQGPAGTASTDTARIDEMLSLDTPNSSIFIDQVNGNDANPGTSFGNAVATMQRAIELCRPYGFNYINLISDIDLNVRIPIDNFTGQLFFRGRTNDGAGVEQRKLRVVDSINFPASRPGSFVINCNMSVRFDAIDVELATSMGYGLFEISVAFLQCFFSNGTFVRTGSGAAKLLHTGSGSVSARFNSVSADPSIEGYLFASISAGQNPNDLFNYSTNLSSA